MPPPVGAMPTVATGRDQRASVGWRLASAALFLVLAFIVLVLVVIVINPDDVPRCEDGVSAEGECFDVTETERTLQIVVSIVGAVVGTAAALAALYFAITGRRGRLVLQLAGATFAVALLLVIVGRT